MAMQATVNDTISMGGKTFGGQASLSGDGTNVVEKTVPAAKAGTLTTRTDANTGSLTMSSGGHGIETGDKVDVFWTISGVTYARTGMTVGTVSGTTVPVDGGSGVDLPSASQAIAACVPVSEPLAFVGNDVVALAYGGGTAQQHVNFLSSVPASLLSKVMKSGKSNGWVDGKGDTNPLAGVTVATVEFSHNNTTTAQTMRAGVLLGA